MQHWTLNFRGKRHRYTYVGAPRTEDWNEARAALLTWSEKAHDLWSDTTVALFLKIFHDRLRKKDPQQSLQAVFMGFASNLHRCSAFAPGFIFILSLFSVFLCRSPVQVSFFVYILHILLGFSASSLLYHTCMTFPCKNSFPSISFACLVYFFRPSRKLVF